jgi:hypothetical protein
MGLKRNREWGFGLDSTGSELGPVVGSCEYDIGPLSYIKGG